MKTIDHRILNKQLKLYCTQKESLGMIFWNPNGWTIFCEIEQFLRRKLRQHDYQEVKTPIIMGQSLWKKTGHWKNYVEYIFTTVLNRQQCCVKPMNCVGHIQIFNQNKKSYRNLPFRVAEFGNCHRNEPSGSLHGLMRLRQFTQDDAHIFCTSGQIYREVKNCIGMIFNVYRIFGFTKVLVKLATRPPKKIGNDNVWDRAECDLQNALKKNRIKFELHPGEGAFYGPKIEFVLPDASNRLWQCGTVQLDFVLSPRLDVSYTETNNQRAFPVIIHRAVLGSLERFIGLLTEKYAGYFPLWLAPVQIVVISVTQKHTKYVRELGKKLLQSRFRVEIDVTNRTVGFKIRKYTLLRIPYIFTCGDKEIRNQSVSVRTFYGEILGTLSVDAILSKIRQEIKHRLELVKEHNF